MRKVFTLQVEGKVPIEAFYFGTKDDPKLTVCVVNMMMSKVVHGTDLTTNILYRAWRSSSRTSVAFKTQFVLNEWVWLKVTSICLKQFPQQFSVEEIEKGHI